MGKILCACLMSCVVLVVGCKRPPAGPAYLPEDLRQRSTISVAEERALKLAEQMATEEGMVMAGRAPAPNVYVKGARCKLERDHVSVFLVLDISVVGGLKAWNLYATTELKKQVYTEICERAIGAFARPLKVDPKVIRVGWQNFPAEDEGTYVDGQMEARYRVIPGVNADALREGMTLKEAEEVLNGTGHMRENSDPAAAIYDFHFDMRSVMLTVDTRSDPPRVLKVAVRKHEMSESEARRRQQREWAGYVKSRAAGGE